MCKHGFESNSKTARVDRNPFDSGRRRRHMRRKRGCHHSKTKLSVFRAPGVAPSARACSAHANIRTRVRLDRCVRRASSASNAFKQFERRIFFVARGSAPMEARGESVKKSRDLFCGLRRAWRGTKGETLSLSRPLLFRPILFSSACGWPSVAHSGTCGALVRSLGPALAS